MLRRLKITAMRRESGFTLIELLVVMIIIGILAAVAIPIFLNQQKTARDTATTSDVKNLATNVQSALVRYPDATFLGVSDYVPVPIITPGVPSVTYDSSGDGKIYLFVGTSSTDFDRIPVSITGMTFVSITPGTSPGDYIIRGWNSSGKVYISSATARKYDSSAGGLS